MHVLAYYVFNASRSQWLQDDEHTWGDFSGAVEFTRADLAESIRQRETKNDDATFTMGAFT